MSKHGQRLRNIPGGASPCTGAEHGGGAALLLPAVSPVPVPIPMGTVTHWGSVSAGAGAWTTPQGWKHQVLQREAKQDGPVWPIRREPHVHVSPESGHGLVVDQFDNSRVILTKIPHVALL